MARPTLTTHPKFAKLVQRLRHTPAAAAIARGALELIWDAGYAEGDPFIGDAETVEAIAQWTGQAGELAAHLVATGFLDLDPEGGHVIHDLADHAPAYVARRMARAAERAASGTTISEIRSRARKQTTTNGIHLPSVTANVAPPAPAPAPRSESLPPARDLGGGGLTPIRPPATPYPLGAATLPFLGVFERYVNPNGKVAAAKVWQDIASGHPAGEPALAAEIGAAFDAGLLKQHPYSGEPRYRPAFEKFLAERRWLDKVAPAEAALARGSPRPDVRIGHARAENFDHTATGVQKL